MVDKRRQARMVEMGIVIVALLLILAVKVTDHYLGDDADALVLTASEHSETESDPQPKESIAVHIKGAVASPGVYEIEQGSRLSDVIELAGGLTQTADDSNLNLAALVYDTQQIVIYNKGEVPPAAANRPVGAWTLQDLNEADAQRLCEISGIGETMASRILEYRKVNGPYQSVDSLIEVTGIGEKKLESIKSAFAREALN